jgi:ABC-type nitrate/sulfonate/bicarbonate transport system substrate-binding protein/signal transduction histidine kinase
MFFLLTLNANSLQKTSIQLMWLDQFEFAGFYVAKEKGFYQELGLDVEIKKFNSSMNLTKEVLDGKSDFGLNSSSLVIDKSQGKDVVILGTIFQSSPLVLLALKDSKLKAFDNFKNKRIMITNNQENFAPLLSMLKSQDLLYSDLKFIPHSFNVDDLINHKTDLMSAYITNEVFSLKEKGYESTIFNPKDYGFDFYDDFIFTSKKFIEQNPETVKRFYKATLKGWEYAFNNIDEVSKLVYEKYNSQNKSLKSIVFEANAMKELVFDNNKNIGTITQERINLMINAYKVMGLIKKDIKADDLIYSKHLEDTFFLNDEEKTYLEKKKVITMCVDPNRMPYEKIENNKHIGISADYIKLIEEKIKTPITFIPTQTWIQSLKFGEERTCDIFSLIIATPHTESFLNFTNPYLNTPLVVATTIETPFIDNFLQIKNKKLAIIKNHGIKYILENKYPDINFIDVEDIQEGLNLVQKGEVFGCIGTLPIISYQIQNNYIGQLKISGKSDEILNLRIGTRNDEPILNDILNKTINEIPSTAKQDILNKWISINYQNHTDNASTYKILAIMIILTFLGILFYRHYLLKRLNLQLNERIELEITKNEEKNRILIQQSRMASMGEMLENIAHQWRQPLSTISVAASGMEVKKEFSSLSDEEFFEAINHIKKATLYLSNTIDDFRNFFSRNKTSEQINISYTIEKSLELMGSSFLHHKINLVRNIKSIEILSLENELIQVLMNILVNSKDALRHIVSAEKYIFIDAFQNENQIIIQIKDNADGIDESIIDKIFEPYFTTKHQFNGTGIGLYMSKLLVEKHLNGTITVRNEEFTFMDKIHKGAVFEIILPIS